MKDGFGREIDYMRVSITDRCNLRCKYCMPDGIETIPMKEILTLDEIIQICEEGAALGIHKIKITGGEPLVRKGCAYLIGQLKQIPGIHQVTLTTNGVLLEQYLPKLCENHVDAINVSLDSMVPERFRDITGFDCLPQVLRGIKAALKCGIPTKVNTVLQKEINEEEWEGILMLARKYPIDVRFIEMMPIGHGKGYTPIYNEEILQRITEKYPDIRPDTSIHGNGPAVYYKIPGFPGSIGMISAMHGKFCGSCNRIRLTSVGRLKPCLCYSDSVDVRQAVRGNGDIREALIQGITRKPENHIFEQPDEMTESMDMVRIGG